MVLSLRTMNAPRTWSPSLQSLALESSNDIKHGLSVSPMAPPSPLMEAFSCLCAWSRAIAENVCAVSYKGTRVTLLVHTWVRCHEHELKATLHSLHDLGQASMPLEQ